jgi:hypothetical protein
MKERESKAYAATLPTLSNRDAESLSNWARDNCYRSRVFPQQRGTAWIAIREKSANRQGWARHVRRVLNALGIDTSPLGGGNVWLQLCDVGEAHAIIDKFRNRPAAPTQTQWQIDNGGDDAKIIELNPGRARRRNRAGGAAAVRKRPERIEVTKG